VVAIALIGAGFTIYRTLLAVLLAGGSAHAVAFDPRNWAAWIGGLIWLPWGLTLAAATYAYHRRRRADRAVRSGALVVAGRTSRHHKLSSPQHS
jgi:uncharacterized protein DUF202